MNDFTCYIVENTYKDDNFLYKVTGVRNWDFSRKHYIGAIYGQDNYKTIEKMNIPLINTSNPVCYQCLKNGESPHGTYSFYISKPTYYNFDLFRQTLLNVFRDIQDIVLVSGRITCGLLLCEEHSIYLRSQIKKYIDKMNLAYQTECNIKSNNMDERTIEEQITQNLFQIEEGMKFVKRQYCVKHGRIDILAKDKNNISCIIEVKSVDDDDSIIYQCVNYPSSFKTSRMITIAPDYIPRIYYALQQLKYVELYQYHFNSNGDMIINKHNQIGI